MAQTVTVQIQSSNGSRRSTNFYFSDAASEAEIQASMNRHLSDLDAAIDGVIVSSNLVKPLDVPATVKDVPNVGANHDNQVRYVFLTDGGYTTTKTISTVPESAVDFTADPPNPTSTELATFTDNIIANPDTGTSPSTDYRGDEISSVKSARAF